MNTDGATPGAAKLAGCWLPGRAILTGSKDVPGR